MGCGRYMAENDLRRTGVVGPEAWGWRRGNMSALFVSVGIVILLIGA